MDNEARTREKSAITPFFISVIIPAVNESAVLQSTLPAICSLQTRFEVIVVDGGSSDETAEIAQASGAHVISSPCRQRAYQLNLGARHARGEVLLFLHADTVLPNEALDHIDRVLHESRIVGGAFARRYGSPSGFLRFTCLLARWRNHSIGWHLGDQAMFVRRGLFFQLGGFCEVDMFEDLDFSRRLRKLGRTVTLRPSVTSSSRRFNHAGPFRTTLRDFGLTMRYLLRGLETRSHQAAAPSDYEIAKGIGRL